MGNYLNHNCSSTFGGLVHEAELFWMTSERLVKHEKVLPDTGMGVLCIVGNNNWEGLGIKA